VGRSAVFVALQIYFVQEMLAALFVCSPGFSLFSATSALVIYLVDRQAQQWSNRLAGERVRPAMQLAPAPWLDFSRDLSKKAVPRPRSETAQ